MTERLFLRLDDDPVHARESNVPSGTLRAWPVSKALRQHVAHVLEYKEVLPPGTEVLERVLPDGAVRLIFNFGDAPTVGDAAGLTLEAVGASAAPALVRLRGRMEGLSVTLRSGAASALLGVPAGELAGRAVPIDQLWSAEGTQALERMAETADAARRVALLEELLARRLSRGEATGQSAALEAVRLIAASGGQRALRDVAAAVGVGERRLQQLFHLQVGLSPRTFSRLARLRGCLRALRRCPAAGWAEVAANAGFYDQSHLINEFRALCGMTPSEFLAHSTSGSSKTTG